nr:MAG TPA: hypothetical protein [Bacteriophage sp.]
MELGLIWSRKLVILLNSNLMRIVVNMNEYVIKAKKISNKKSELLEDERLWSLDDYIAQLVISYCKVVIQDELGTNLNSKRAKNLSKIQKGLEIKYKRSADGYSKYELETDPTKKAKLDKKFKEALKLLTENFEWLWW